MGGLIWRTAAGVCAGLVALIALTLVLTSTGGGPVPHAAAHFLEQTWPRAPFAGDWSVRRIEPRPGRIRVLLTVADTPAAGFLRMPDGARRLTFGPSCPRPEHPVWERLPAETDIHLRPVSVSGEVIMERLSCRDWNRLGTGA